MIETKGHTMKNDRENKRSSEVRQLSSTFEKGGDGRWVGMGNWVVETGKCNVQSKARR